MSRVECYFDLASPLTYLAAERVDRALAKVAWIPCTAPALREVPGAQLRVEAQQRAAALRLPLVWPDRPRAEVPGAMRAAHHAVDQGRAAPFVLAACRLAWAGGFDLEEPAVLAEAAAAAGMAVDACLEASRDASRDELIAWAGRRITALGAELLPAIVVDGVVFAGEERIAEAVALVRATG